MLRELLTNRVFWEQPVLDLWTIPHFLTGVLIALAVRALGANVFLGFLASAALAVLWELFENLLHVSDAEFLSNQFADILFTQIGFLVTILLIREKHQKKLLSRIGIIVSVVFVITVVLGWAAYWYYV